MIDRYNKILLPLFYIFDIFIVLGSFLISYYAKFGDFFYFYPSTYFSLLIYVFIIWALSSLIFKTYEEKQAHDLQFHIFKLFLSQSIMLLFIFMYIVATKGNFSREFIALFLILQLILITGIHVIRRNVVVWWRKKGRNYKKLIVLGKLEPNGDNKYWDFNNPEYGYRVEDTIQYSDWVVNYAELLENTLQGKEFDELLIVSPATLGNQIESVIHVAEDHGLRVMVIPKFMRTYTDRVFIDYINGKPIMSIRNEPLKLLHKRIIKRAFDIVFSSVVIVLFYWWFRLLVGVFIKLSSEGPVVFKQKRVGVDGKEFLCYKFRTMKQNGKDHAAAENGFGDITRESDSRITWIGKLLRKTNLDELPQFLNVLKGEMSVVGPRPHMIQEDLEIRKKVSKYRVRNFVKPGITGWAQVNGYRGGTDDLKLMKKRTNLDIFYVERWTFILDLKIVWNTFWQMIRFNVPNAY